MINVTEKALSAIAQAVKDTSQSVGMLVNGYGWGGPVFGIALDEQKDGDKVILVNDQKFVVEDQLNNKVAGYAYYSAFRAISGYRQSIEHSVFVDPSYARQGLGKALMQQLIHLAIQQNMHIMVAAIDSENMGSIVLHEQLGFVQTGYMPQVGQKFGQWRDLVWMQLQLSS